jgi:hypothetical protein
VDTFGNDADYASAMILFQQGFAESRIEDAAYQLVRHSSAATVCQ